MKELIVHLVNNIIPRLKETSMSTATEHLELERAGRVEVRGTDYIPDSERLGKPRELFWVWISANVTYLYFVIGGILMLLGLSLWEALVISVIGNLWWLLIGWLSISGPASGTPTVMIMRSFFGIRGNKVFGAGLGVVVGLFYEIVNIALGTLAAIAFLSFIGIPESPVIAWIALIVVTLASFVISVFGHATIIKLSPIFSAILAVCFALLAVFVMSAADFSYQVEPLPSLDHWTIIFLGLVIVASSPISWGTGADFARYLPQDVSKKAVIGWTAAGGFIPAVLITLVGVFAGTSIDMTDPQITLLEIVPAWFYAVFLGAIVLSSITNNVLVAYSTGLYFQELGTRIARAWTVVITGTVAFVLAALMLFVAPDFIDTLNSSLELGVAIFAPLITIYGVDILLRKNTYNGLELNRRDKKSPFWYSGGIFWPGVIALVVASTVAVLSSNTTLYVGPIAESLGGLDISSIVAPILAGVIYAVLWSTTNPYKNKESRPTA
jgi:purine-cytosine permease-like protein